MHIAKLRSETSGDAQVVLAEVEWEDTDRPPDTVRISVTGLPCSLEPSPDSMLVACAVPAFAAGERRISIDTPCSPLLLASLPGMLALIGTWSPRFLGRRSPPRIEAQVELSQAATVPRTALFFSAGVDSTHLLLQRGRPGGYGILINGFDVGGKRTQSNDALYDEIFKRSAPLLAARGILPLQVSTNIRHIDDRSEFWGDCFVGFALAAVAHALGGAASLFEIASNGEPLNHSVQSPDGIHPTLLYGLSSERVRLLSPCLEISRMKRLRMIAQKREALAGLRVCFNNAGGYYNCGECEKCLRTALALMVIGVDPAPLFSGKRPEPAAFRRENIDNACVAAMYAEIRDAMHGPEWSVWRRQISNMLDRWVRYERWMAGRTLGGRLRTLRQTLANKEART